jgi:hypothetical protein
MSTNYIIYSRSLSEAQSNDVNSGGWGSVIWGNAYLDLGFLDRENLKSIEANLLTLHIFGIYKRGYNIQLKGDHDRGNDKKDWKAQEILFRTCNIEADHPEVESFYQYDRTPALSVGDLAFLDDYSQGWICCNIGWAKLPKTICEHWRTNYMTDDMKNWLADVDQAEISDPLKSTVQEDLNNIEVSALELVAGNYHKGELFSDIQSIADDARRLKDRLQEAGA